MTGLKSDTDSSTTTLLDHMESDDRANSVDVEKESATVSSAPSLVQTNRVTLIFWMVMNTVATVAIVSRVFWGTLSSECVPSVDLRHDEPPRLHV